MARSHLAVGARRLGVVAAPAAVWLLGIWPPPRGGLTWEFVAPFSLAIIAVVAVDQTAPTGEASWWRRLAWLAALLVVCWLTVRAQGGLIRPSLIYIVPASRALFMFGERQGVWLSLSVWLAYGLNVLVAIWPDNVHEFPNYLPFFLPPYVVAVFLSLATLRQANDRRQLQVLYDQLQTAHVELQALHARAREAAVAEERNRLAREIHDSVAHYLTVVNIQLEAVEKTGLADPEPALARVQRARRLILESLQEVRRSVAALRATTLEELALPPALAKLAAEFSDSTGIDVQCNLTMANEVRLAPELSLALFRAAQEGLTNAQKHAQAKSARLTLQLVDGWARLTLTDDGIGPTSGANGDSAGFGLLGLRERLDLLGGRIEFGPGPNGGSRLVVEAPLRAEP